MRIRILVFACLNFISFSHFSQVVGGRGNSDMTPKAVEPDKLNAGSLSGDVNIFSGEYNASLPLGSVSTPGGLGFTLNYSYSSAFATGGTPQIARGIPYGDGWSLNIPTVSVETDVFNEFLRQQYCEEGAGTNGTKLRFDNTTDAAAREGDLYWFSPTINIPGVASGRAVLKYIDATDGQAAVFVLNTFESPVEIRFYGSYWDIILADGTRYRMEASILGTRAPSNTRTLYYDQDLLNYENEPRVQDDNNNLYESVQNAILPKKMYSTWFCTRITNTNIPLQSIWFEYEKYGAFNYFNEFLQPNFAQAFRTAAQNTTLNALYDYTSYSDILLKTVTAHGPQAPIEQLKLDYGTDFSVLNAEPQLINYKIGDAYRVDSLYSAVPVSVIKGSDNFSGWRRYNHVKKNELAPYDMTSPSNPYQTTGGAYIRENALSANRIAFDHGFLESQRINASQLYPGDIYEIKTRITRDNPNSEIKGNSTFDIAVVTGNCESSPINPTGLPFTNLDQNSGNSFNSYSSTRSVSVFSTFNMALKWHLNYQQAALQTSNFFVMPNIPDGFQGINIQIGPGNSDNNFAFDLNDPFGKLILNGKPNAKESYSFTCTPLQYSMKSAAQIPHNFGIGLPWSNVLPLYKLMATSNANSVIDPVSMQRAFQFWWANGAILNNPDFENRPTKADETTFLDEFELIRYSKNPFMLKGVTHYRFNGEIRESNETGWKKLSEKKLEYKTEHTTLIENFNYQNGDQVVAKNSGRQQIHILLKAIREIPVDYDPANPDTLKTLATFLDYSLYDDGFDQTFQENNIHFAANKYLLKGIVDQLGGQTRVYYYAINDPVTYFNNESYSRETNCGGFAVNNDPPFGMSQATTVHAVVKKITKIDENTTGNGISNHSWIYNYDPQERVGIISDYTIPETHFRNRYYKAHRIGFRKVTVLGPLLNNTDFTRTEYEHYANDENAPAIENHLFFGKMKTVKTYDAQNVLHSEKIYNYGYTLAFENAHLRPDYYRSQLNYDERDYNRMIHNYEYKDYYLEKDNPLDRNQYEGLDIASLKGNAEFFEMPKFLEFPFYDDLLTQNPEYLFQSYFVKTNQEIDRTYENYSGIPYTKVTKPRILPDPVPENPGGGGLENPGGGSKPEDVNLHAALQAQNGNGKTKERTLIEASPLSEFMLVAVISANTLQNGNKTAVLLAQQGLSNSIWNQVLANEGSFTPQQLLQLIAAQPYFADAVQNQLLTVNHSNLDPKVFEALLLRNEKLSASLVQNLLEGPGYRNSQSLAKVLAQQPPMDEASMIKMVNSPRVLPTQLPEVLQNKVLNDAVYGRIAARADLPETVIATIFENDPFEPTDGALLHLMNRLPILGDATMTRIFAAIKTTISMPVETRLNELIPEEGRRKQILGKKALENPLGSYCNNSPVSSRNFIETRTDYEYFEADYKGASDGRAYKILLGLQDVPGRTASFNGKVMTLDQVYLKHEPSWQVFSKKVSSPHLPGAYSEEQYFYGYDLKNKYDRYWFNYDLNSGRCEVQEFDLGYPGKDTLGYFNDWDSHYTVENAVNIPRFDILVYTQDKNLRSLPFQKTMFTKNQRDSSAVMRSEYYEYDARWEFDTYTPPVRGLTYDGPSCNVSTPPPPTPCDRCFYEKHPTLNAAMDALPFGYCLWEVSPGYFYCPSEFTSNPCSASALKIMCNPTEESRDTPTGGTGGPAAMLPLNTALSRTLQLRASHVQLDTIPLNQQSFFEIFKMDAGNSYLAEFYLTKAEVFNENGFVGDYRMLMPFDYLTTFKVLERNQMLQTQLVENQVGLKTKYYYRNPVQREYLNNNCTDINSGLSRIWATYSVDAGLPVRITIGAGRADSMSSTYTYNDFGKVVEMVQPSGHKMAYTYDGFQRLTSLTENGNRLLARSGYHYWPHDGSMTFDQRTAQNYVQSITYNNYVDSPTLVDTNQQELGRAFIDPLGREHSALRQYDNHFLYSGTVRYDTWDRVYESYKPTADELANPSLNLRVNTSTPKMTTRFENNPKSRAIRTADYGVDIANEHTVRSAYLLVNDVYASCELNLSRSELLLLMNQGITENFLFLRTSILDQDSKEVVTYTNALGQKVATLAFLTSNNAVEKVITLFAYDSQGNLNKVINPEKQESKYEYNLIGKLVREITVDAGERRYMYNKQLQVSVIQDQLHSDRKMMVNGTEKARPVVRRFTYDDYGRMLEQKSLSISALYNYMAYKNTLVGNSNGTPVLVDGISVYFNYLYSAKSSLDWMYNYQFWNGTSIKLGGPGQPEIYQPGINAAPQQTTGEPPVAVDDLNINVEIGTALTFSVLNNDTDVDNDIITTSIDLDPFTHGRQTTKVDSYGLWEVVGSQVKFTALFDLTGTTTCRYQIRDLGNNTSNMARIVVTINNTGYVNNPEKTWAYGLQGNLATVGKLLQSTSFNNSGVAIQRTEFTYDAQDRVASQLVTFHPTDLVNGAVSERIQSRISYPAYNFRGSLLQENIDLNNDNVVDFQQFYGYDDLNRLQRVSAARGTAADESQATLLASYGYDNATGLLQQQKHHLGAAATAQEIAYVYDIRNRLTALQSELLDYQLFYDAQQPPAYNGEQVSAGQNYNGNINGIAVNYHFAAQSGLTNFNEPAIYGYTYDQLNRLVQADGLVGDFVAASGGQTQQSYLIGDESYSFDRIGNLKTLQRYLRNTAGGQAGSLEGFTYNYQAGSNRLTGVNAQAGGTDRAYSYDANGNALTDSYKKISQTDYGRAAYAYRQVVDGSELLYLYDVGDARIYKSSTKNGITKQEYYLKDAGGKDVAVYDYGTSSWNLQVYGAELVARISGGTGAINAAQSTFFLYDHLGNTRVSYQAGLAANPALIQYAADYFPYGKILREFANGAIEKYLTTGHERDQETGLDYRGARYYDSDIARFLSVDPLAAKYVSWSTYNYVMSNPVMMIDPSGREATDWFLNKQNGNLIYIKGQSEVTKKSLDEMGSTYNPSDYERLGSDNMFGDTPLVLTPDGKDFCDNKYGVVNSAQAEVLMDFVGYSKAKRVTIKEREFISGGRMGGEENFSSIAHSMEIIGSPTFTYLKSDQMDKLTNKFENVKTKLSKTYNSSIETVTYKTIVPAGQNKPKKSYFDDKNVGADTGKVLEVIGTILQNFHK